MKKRLDLLVLEHGLAESREKGKALIMSGLIYVDGQKADKPGDSFEESSKVELRGKGLRYVSRGGLKLEKAMDSFALSLNGQTCMDVGASTGGFTDCMLQNGAVKVYAVDVGYGQLAWGLRNDPRVVNLERTNARYLTREAVPEDIDFCSMDVSFISLTLLLPVVRQFLSPTGKAVCLIKPQFEAGRNKVGKKGVVSDPAVHVEVIRKIVDFSLQNGFSVLGLTFSPVKGPEGNIEYLILLEKAQQAQSSASLPSPESVVQRSHETLDRK